MSRETHGRGPLFGALVEHLSTHDEEARARIADLYDAPSENPDELALHWCRSKEYFLEVLDDHLDEEGWYALEQLAFEHDMPVDIGWMDPSVEETLEKLGLLGRLLDAVTRRGPGKWIRLIRVGLAVEGQLRRDQRNR